MDNRKQPTLRDIIDTLKQEEELTRESGKENTVSLSHELVDISNIIGEQSNYLRQLLNLEEKINSERKRKEELEKVQRTEVPDREEDSFKEKISDRIEDASDRFTILLSRLTGLGIVVGSVALALGSALGVVTGQLRAVQFFFPRTITGITNVVDNFSTSITNIMGNVSSRVGQSFDDFIAWVRSMFATNSSSRIGRVFSSFRSTISGILSPFVSATETLTDIISGPLSRISGVFGSIRSLLSTFASSIAGVARLVGRIFAPIAVIMAAVEGIRESIQGYADDGVWGAVQGAIDGLFTSLIAAPLDLLTAGVAWILEQFGFDSGADVLRNFSFVELWDDLTDHVFRNLQSAFRIIEGLFSFTEEDRTALGALGALRDIVFAPVNIAINFVRGMFGFEEQENPFKLQDWIDNKIEEVITFVGDLFDFLPTIEEARTRLLSLLPDWMQPESIEDQRQRLISDLSEQRRLLSEGDTRNWRGQSRESIISELESELRDLSFRKGTSGFMDFGRGTPSILHGVEAVVPRNTPAGNFLANNFDQNWRPIVSRLNHIESEAISNRAMSPVIFTNAPVVAPINNNVRGSTNYNSQRFTSLAEGSGSGLGRFAN